MTKQIIISESEKNSIKRMYSLINNTVYSLSVERKYFIIKSFVKWMILFCRL